MVHDADRLRIVEVTLEFRHPFATATATLQQRNTVLVGIGSGGTFGWGEAAPFPGVTHETIDDVWEALAAVDGDPRNAAGLPPTAAAALDEAHWDLEARLAGESSSARLGASGRPVPLSAAVGIAPDVATLAGWVDEAVAAGVRGVKLKIRPGWDVEPITEIRRRHPHLVVSADANGSFPDAADPVFGELDRLGLDHLEQPLPAGDLAGAAELTARLATAICLDETVTSTTAALGILDRGAADLICLKPGRLGIRDLVGIHDRAVERGVGVKISGMLESGVGRAHTLAVCGLPGVVAADLAPTEWYFTGDIVTPPLVVVDGHATVPATGGIGVVPEPTPASVVRALDRRIGH